MIIYRERRLRCAYEYDNEYLSNKKILRKRYLRKYFNRILIEYTNCNNCKLYIIIIRKDTIVFVDKIIYKSVQFNFL